MNALTFIIFGLIAYWVYYSVKHEGIFWIPRTATVLGSFVFYIWMTFKIVSQVKPSWLAFFVAMSSFGVLSVITQRIVMWFEKEVEKRMGKNRYTNISEEKIKRNPTSDEYSEIVDEIRTLNKKKEKDKTIKRNIVYEETNSLDLRNSQIPSREKSNNNSKTSTVFPRRQNTALPNLNTGIQGLDGPGVYHRLFQYGQTGEALYILYSKSHNAYKIGHSRPKDLEQRIRRIQPEVPDIALDGLTVFTSVQRAHDREQNILNFYANKRYRGIKGRDSGRTEWLTVRPSRPRSIKSIEKIEVEFNKDQNSSAQDIKVKDIYTVYLMFSPSRRMYYCSWCNTNNIEQKIKTQQREFSRDANIISRMPFDSKEKARATRNSFNELTNTYKKEGRKEIINWTDKKDYVGKFQNWDLNGRKR